MLSSFPLARTQSTHSAPVRVTQSNLPHSLTGVALAAAKKTPRAGSRPRLGPLVRLHIAVCHTSSLIWLARRALRPLSAHADWLGAHSLLPPRSGRSWTPSTRRTRTSAATHDSRQHSACQWISQAAREDLAALAATHCASHNYFQTRLATRYCDFIIFAIFLFKFSAFFHYAQ
jgi:hypothetical protein